MRILLLLASCLQIHICIAQNVGIGTPTPLSKLHIIKAPSGGTPFAFSPLAIENNDHTYINLLSPNISETGILFGKADNAASGGIIYNHSITPNGFHFRTNGNITRMIINQFGLVGIGTTNPQALLHVNGSAEVSGPAKVQSLTIGSGGVTGDQLVKTDVAGTIGFRKGYTGLGMHYIIALQGVFPSTSSPFQNGTYIGEIKLFSGTQAPYGWAFCEGQTLTTASNPNLFSVIGTIYGGDGVSNFALPDLRDAVPVGPGTKWGLGEKSN